MLLDKEQRIGATVLLSIAFVVWVVVSLWPQEPVPNIPQQDSRQAKHIRDSLRRDSIRMAKEARWQHYKDSTREADSIRFVLWTQERQARYDSFRIADSLWRDSVGWHKARVLKKDTVLNLNTADTTELTLIRGIGPYTARRIVRYRESLGGFYSTSQLTDEPLSDLRLDSVIPSFFVTTDRLRTLPVNSCSPDQLSAHPYLRHSQAKAIYHLRRQRVRLNSIEELRSLPELTPTDISRIAPYLSFEY